MEVSNPAALQKIPWNKGKLVGQKPPLRLKEIWAIRIRLQLARRARELALFNLALDSKLRGCDLVQTRDALAAWIARAQVRTRDYLFPSRTRRRTKATLIYRRTKNLRAVQLLLGHTKLESTVRYLGIEVDDALEIAEQTEI